MNDFTVTVVGTGVIGTSLGLALKQAATPPRLIAHDKELTLAGQAVKMGAFDKAEWNLINACEPADLIILATPLNAVQPTLAALAPYLKPNAVITDTCASKQAVLGMAAQLLPGHVHFVSGYPIVQPAGTGCQNARADLFKNRRYCLSPAPTAAAEAVELLAGLVTLLGAEPFFIDPAEYDGLLTAVEHLPAALSVALLRLLTPQSAWREQQKLAGSRFEQVSAGAGGDPDSLKDAFLANKAALAYWLDAYLQELQSLRTLLISTEDAGETLAQYLDAAVVARLNWLKDYRQGGSPDPELKTIPVEIPGLLERLVGFGGFRKQRPNDR